MALVEKNKLLSPRDIINYHLGGLLSGGGSKPAVNEPEQWRLLVDGYQKLAAQTCLQIPLLYGVDANHGHGNVPGATVFPHFIGLGATHDPVLVQRVAQATAEEMLATGIEWNFSPDLDVARDYRWGRVYETFGSDADNVALLGRAFIEGTQMTTAGSRRALATAKHFVGSGEMLWGSSINKKYKIDQGRSAITEQELRAVHLSPFKAAVEGGVLSIMAGLNSWDGQKLTAQKYLLTDVLKKELGFQGFVVSDWYGVYEVNPNKYLATVKAINAGTDMVMLPIDYQIFTADMLRAVAAGDITKARLDDAVSRILRAKFTAGLFDQEERKTDLSVIGSDSHRTLAREAVQKSLVLLKNDSKVLPLAKDLSHIVVAGTEKSGNGTVPNGSRRHR
jgi:beta-glucosidase